MNDDLNCYTNGVICFLQVYDYVCLINMCMSCMLMVLKLTRSQSLCWQWVLNDTITFTKNMHQNNSSHVLNCIYLLHFNNTNRHSPTQWFCQGLLSNRLGKVSKTELCWRFKSTTINKISTKIAKKASLIRLDVTLGKWIIQLKQLKLKGKTSSRWCDSKHFHWHFITLFSNLNTRAHQAYFDSHSTWYSECVYICLSIWNKALCYVICYNSNTL